jgi:hypothetical protein
MRKKAGREAPNEAPASENVMLARCATALLCHSHGSHEVAVKKSRFALLRAVAFATSMFLVAAAPSEAQDEWQAVAQALGKAGTLNGSIYRVGLPRTDIKATLDGVELKPGFALGGWLAFEKMGQ